MVKGDNPAMREWINDVTGGHFAAVYLFLFVTVALRSSLMYWIGRYGAYLVAAGPQPRSGLRRSAWRWARSERTAAAMSSIRRKGWVVIPFSFLTVGFQSVVVIAAGVLRMSWGRFALAALPGWLAWALIYSTIGFTVWAAMVAALATTPVGIGIVMLCVVGLVSFFFVYRRKQRKNHGQ